MEVKTRIPASAQELNTIDAYWRAANYLSACQLYLLDNPLLEKPLTRDMISDHFRIDRCLEDCSGIFQFMTKLDRIRQITIMGNHQCTFHIIQNQWLCIFRTRSSCCRIPYMSDTEVSL